MEQMTIVLSKFESHDEETFQAQKEVWTEYSKEFSDATGVKYYWAHQEQEDGVYYIGVNLFPSKESRDAWIANYDVAAGEAEFDAKMLEKTGKTAEEREAGKLLEINMTGMDIDLTNEQLWTLYTFY